MSQSNSRNIVIILAAIIVISLAWFFISPLFIDRAVDEELPFSSDDAAMPSRAVIDAMEESERNKVMTELMDAAAEAPDVVMDEEMTPVDAPRAIQAGNFRDADAIHHGSGDATLYALPDGAHLLRFENFRVTNGPALVVYLAEHPDPNTAADVSAGFLSLGKLKGNVGNQNYQIPAGVDISGYRSAVIWCELFDVLFSPAAFAAIEISDP